MNALKEFFKLESASGILLMFAAALALVVANSPLSGAYNAFLDMPVVIQVGKLEIAKPLLLWINDGFMAIFFFLVGLELKREIRTGQLSKPENIMLPAIGAVGGMLMPPLVYVYFTHSDPVALAGWAIPAATDIAFALGVLALLGSRIPTSLKVFLVSLAIIDDIGAIVIIALFYTENISTTPLIVAAVSVAILWWMNKRNVTEIASYLLVGVVLWVAMLKSGVHATLAGVVLAFFIPMYDRKKAGYLPLQEMEHSLHPAVAYAILPLFAFANAGIDFSDISMDAIAHPVTLGVLLGLVIGKQVGVFGFCWAAVKAGVVKLPSDINMKQLYGTACLCGIGFTMSLFIGSLAFSNDSGDILFDERIGILGGSLISAITGYLILRFSSEQGQE